jgi:nucleoside-diphosphate-sugar epimerase
LIPVPARVVRLALTALNQRDAGQRLCGSLQVDNSKVREVLNWKPPVDVDEALRRVATDFLGSHSDTNLSERLAIA